MTLIQKIIFPLLFVLLVSCSHAGVTEKRFAPARKFYYGTETYLNYRVVGEGGTTIVCLHGFGASSQTWNDILPVMDLDATYILFDLIGWGFSSEPEQGDYSMTANADAISRFIVENELYDVVLVGHSFGGGVALMTALKLLQDRKHKPSSLILLAPAAYKTKFPFFVKILRVPVLRSLLLSLTTAEYRAHYALEQAYYDPAKVTNDKVDRYSFFMKKPGHNRTLKKTAQQIIPENFETYIEQYGSLNLPVLIVWGDHDSVLPEESGYRLEKDLPQVTLEIVEDCGHNVQEECPAETARAITPFLEKGKPGCEQR
jgi:pimeloyl-ACP methyl ester carboxylesterase